MEYISNFMFWISNGLLVPVIVGLIYLFIRSIILLGGFCNVYITRKKQQQKLRGVLDSLSADNLDSLKGVVGNDTEFAKTVGTIIDGEHTEAYVARAVSMYEVSSGKTLESYKMLIKFGPILGLMGTLIPMGPALAGLSAGDISSMAYNMQVAFATTVIGLFAGAVGFALLQIRQRWTNADLAQLDYIADLYVSRGQNVTEIKEAA